MKNIRMQKGIINYGSKYLKEEKWRISLNHLLTIGVHHNQISSKYSDIQEKSARRIRIKTTNFLLQKLSVNFSFHENYYFNDLSDFAEFISSKKNILPASDFKSAIFVLFNMILNLIYQNCGSIEFLLYILKYKHFKFITKKEKY